MALQKLSWKCSLYQPSEPLIDTPYSIHHVWPIFCSKPGNITQLSRKHPEFTHVILIFLHIALHYQWRNQVRVLGRSQWGHSSGRLCQQGSILNNSLQVVIPLHFPLFPYSMPLVWSYELLCQIWISLFQNWLNNGLFHEGSASSQASQNMRWWSVLRLLEVVTWYFIKDELIHNHVV